MTGNGLCCVGVIGKNDLMLNLENFGYKLDSSYWQISKKFWQTI